MHPMDQTSTTNLYFRTEFLRKTTIFVVIESKEDFWRPIVPNHDVWRQEHPHVLFTLLFVKNLSRKAKVDDFQMALRVNCNVVGLQVLFYIYNSSQIRQISYLNLYPMNNVRLVQIIDPTEQLVNQERNFSVLIYFRLYDGVQCSVHVLHHKNNFVEMGEI